MRVFNCYPKPYCIKTKRPIPQGHLPPARPTPCGGGAGMDGPPRADEQASASARHWVALPPSARYPARPPASPEPSGVGRGRGVSPMLPGGHLPVVNPFVDSLFSPSPFSPPLLSAVLGMGAPKDSSSFTGNEPSVSLNPRAEGGGPGGRARRPGRGADGSSEVKSPDEVQAPVLPGARPRAFVTADGKRAAGFVVLIENLLRFEQRAWVPARLPRALRPQAARGASPERRGGRPHPRSWI